MSKVKEVKKKNAKFRRQIRKTVGALFMASAIVVAAIPVPDIEAEDLKADAVTDTRADLDYDPTNHDIDYDMRAQLNGPGTNPVTSSYYVRDMGDTWSLNWQFQYYTVDVNNSAAAIISDYNETFQEKEIKIDSYTSDKYYVVTHKQFNDFYETGEGNTNYIFRYDPDYLAYRANGDGAKTDDMKWMEQYRAEEYAQFLEKCEFYYDYNEAQQQYDQAIAEWEAAGSDPKTKPEKPEILNQTPPIQPGQLEYSPKDDFTPEEKYQYYCDKISSINSVGEFTLVPAKDGTPEATEPDIFLVKTETPNANTDNLGFLLLKTSPVPVLGVASGAFKLVQNVETLILPESLKYIGDEAFVGSFIQNVKLNNVQHIGNRAFKGCSDLKSVSMAYTSKIGAECFFGTGITEVAFPSLLSEIGYGAFAKCGKLSDINLNQITAACTIGGYAFFDDPAINTLQMDTSGVSSLGEGAFALESAPTGGLKDVVLPNGISGTSGSILGDLLFAGRTNLETVKFPGNYGTSSSNAVNIPSGMFKNCANLSCVDFTAAKGSTINGFVGYDIDAQGAAYNNLFIDVINPDFQIKGPETNLAGEVAYPRRSTWGAFTRVSNFVPYNYVNASGVNCYEVSDGKYLLQANENGELTSCELIDRNQGYPIDIIIPSKVGNYPITKISSGCFSDQALREAIRSIEIEDNSIQTVDNSVFEGLENLEWVEIGNSVQSIGTRAFADCPKLIDVTFHSPTVGHAGFTIGNEAFKTGSNELTFHGDIVKGYAPFDFALGKDTGKIDDAGKRICYKSLAPDFLTVMYDNKTENVTLLDYPKYNELDDRNAEYCDDMELFYTTKYGSGQSIYDGYRNDFAKAWVEAASDADRTALYDGPLYGPWIDNDFTKNGGGYDEWLNNNQGVTVPAISPQAFYSLPGNQYSIINNYERGSNARGEFETVTDEELQWINTCLNIVIPEGVTSIDAPAFFDATENTRNVTTYFGSDDEGYKSYQMCTSKADDAVPGLFSGSYKDYDEDSQYEVEVRGNDRILSIVMSDVKYLPDYAFDSCERLQNVVLGDDCQDIGTAPFRGCDSLTDIAGNDYFAAENRILYSVNDDGTYTIEECLPSRGKTGSSPIVISSTDPKIAQVSEIREGAFEDCDDIVKVLMGDAKELQIVPKDCFNDCDMLNEVVLPSSVNRIDSMAFGGNESIEVTIPGKEVHIVSDAFEHVSTNTINTYKGTSADDYGKYHNINVEYLSDLYTVKFVDNDGTLIKEITDIISGHSVEPPADPQKPGYTFTGWKPENGYVNVTEDRTLIAQYIDNSGSANRHTVTFYAYDGKTVVSTQYIDHEGAATAPMPPSRSGYHFVAWVPNTYAKVTQDLNIVASYEKNNSDKDDDDDDDKKKPSASPTASPSASPEVKKYTVSVSGGSGSGSYAAGAIVAVNAYFMGDGQSFDKWTSSTAGVGFANPNSSSTTFTMPAANVAVTATYKTGTSGNTNTGGSSNTGNSNTGGSSNTGSNQGGTSVEITKPGISNGNLAGATVSGATDNFIVKVTEDPNAADAVVGALQAKYGDISRIRYLPMDISLYDATGRTKIADTSGISVNLTLPLPDDLVQYAGNNRIAAVKNGSLEDLNARFTTVDGVPCINFTASHFSPYVIYVDTANLTEGTIDATPKTGDPIHPKWFLALGMACISLILFFKKDKAMVSIKKA